MQANLLDKPEFLLHFYFLFLSEFLLQLDRFACADDNVNWSRNSVSQAFL